MKKEQLDSILELHRKWLYDEDDGERADLRGADLRGADLYGANLYGANLYGADLYGADLRGANLYGADLRGANLYGADLYGANLYGADLYGADLYGANLYGANLRGANLYGADLRGADLRGADLRGADLRGATGNDYAAAATEIVPREGSFVGWKKARYGECGNECIIKLRITEDAKRSNATGRKCRCSKATVLEITTMNGDAIKNAYSDYDASFKYETGRCVEVSHFDNNRFAECSTGIHFFLTPEEARCYRL